MSGRLRWESANRRDDVAESMSSKVSLVEVGRAENKCARERIRAAMDDMGKWNDHIAVGTVKRLAQIMEWLNANPDRGLVFWALQRLERAETAPKAARPSWQADPSLLPKRPPPRRDP